MILCAIGGTEIILICAVILLIFGGKKLPELMKGMGKGIRSFKEGMNEPSEEELSRRGNSRQDKTVDRTDSKTSETTESRE